MGREGYRRGGGHPHFGVVLHSSPPSSLSTNGRGGDPQPRCAVSDSIGDLGTARGPDLNSTLDVCIAGGLPTTLLIFPLATYPFTCRYGRIMFPGTSSGERAPSVDQCHWVTGARHPYDVPSPQSSAISERACVSSRSASQPGLCRDLPTSIG